MQKKLSNVFRLKPWACAPLLGLLLSACGGGGDAAVDPPGGGVLPPVAVTGSATGVFSDSPVQGVAFSTTSGVTGTTDAAGRYTYNPSDTVTFKLGAVTLGSAPANALVTPVDLADGNANRLQNLLVTLQSLDDDGDAANGIKIPAAAAAAVLASVDLTQAPASFASAANAGLTAAMTAGGISRAITTTAQAETHFLSQALAQLGSQVWVGVYEGGGGFFARRVGADGSTLGGEIGPAGGGGSSGMEYGTVRATAVDAQGYKLAATVAIDTNGSWGMSGTPLDCERVRLVGDKLVLVGASGDCKVTTTVNKAENDPAGIVGVWALGSATQVKTQTFIFWANGKYAMLDPEGDTDNNCGGPGVEYGSYSYSATTKTLAVLGVTVDTNGCAGFHEDGQPLPSFNVALSSDGSSASVNGGEFTLYRVSK